MSIYMNVSHGILVLQAENEKLEALSATYEDKKLSLTNYIIDADLVSEAYENHKQYITMAQIPTLNGLIDLCHRMITANNKYIECVSTMVLDGVIDQELWERTLLELKLQYDGLYISMANVQDVENDEIQMWGYRPSTSYGREYNHTEYIINNLQDEINVLYTLIEVYKNKLVRLEDMLMGVESVYADCVTLQESVQAAITQLSKVEINSDGTYVIDSMDSSAFAELNNNVVTLQIKDAIVAELGEEAVKAFVSGMLSQEEKENMIVQMVDIAADFAPSISTTAAYIEIMVWPWVTVYYNNTVSIDIGESVPVGLSLYAKDNGEYLSSMSVSYEDLVLKGDRTSNGIRYKKDIDENSYYYVDLAFKREDIVCEYGVTTNIKDERNGIDYKHSITTAAGIKVTPTYGTWQPETVSDLAYCEIAEPEWEVEVVTVRDDVQKVEIDPIKETLESMGGEYDDLALYGGMIYKFVTGGLVTKFEVYSNLIYSIVR